MKVSKILSFALFSLLLTGCSSDEFSYPSLYQIPSPSADLQGQERQFKEQEDDLEALKKDMNNQKENLLKSQQEEGLGLSIKGEL